MRRLLLILFLMFLTWPQPHPLEASTWIIGDLPRDRATESILHSWIETNRDDFCYGFDDDQAALLKRLVSGVLVWSQANGNRFEPAEFLSLFSRRTEEELTWCVFPSGGMIFVLGSSYMRIALDPYVPQDLPPHLGTDFPAEGRWFLAFGSGNRTNMVYLQHLNSVWETPLTPLPPRENHLN